ncbi:ion channel [Gelidibacter algens]|uniref:Ion channel n=1 Tax=Gelidibacter algens TaxID=49280 RepID=A0A327SH07_9FLAO|nr:ion channel [Gelidibacter algens]
MVLGIGIQVLVLVDIFKTIIYINGAGFLTNFVSKTIWSLFYKLSKGNGRSKLLDLCGPMILLFFLFMWISLIWLGYSLIYMSDSASVMNTETDTQATVIGKIYFVGYTLTSLGNGDYRAGSEVWQIVSNIMGLNSMIFISLGISYLLPVLQSVIDKRTLAVQITMLGSTPQAIIENGYDGKDFSPLYQRFTNLESILVKHGERHLAYPILHYFHSNDRRYALPLKLATLDEVVLIQKLYNIDDSSKNFHWEILGATLNNFYERLDSNFVIEADEVPPFDYKDKLPKEFAHKVLSKPQFELKNVEERRKKIRGYVRNDGWTWDDVIRSPE